MSRFQRRSMKIFYIIAKNRGIFWLLREKAGYENPYLASLKNTEIQLQAGSTAFCMLPGSELVT